MTHSTLWADLGMIIMDYVANLSSSSAELDFVNATFNPAVIRPGQIILQLFRLILLKDCQTLNQTMINQYHLLNLSSLVSINLTTSFIHALSQMKRLMQKKKSSILTWI